MLHPHRLSRRTLPLPLPPLPSCGIALLLLAGDEERGRNHSCCRPSQPSAVAYWRKTTVHPARMDRVKTLRAAAAKLVRAQTGTTACRGSAQKCALGAGHAVSNKC
eukprot:XP_001696890.1 predicted protein [Chlamydomonas reinhardtii]